MDIDMETKNAFAATIPKACYVCEICGDDLSNYEPKYCCNGQDCGCQGRTIDPPLCHKCYKNVMSRH